MDGAEAEAIADGLELEKKTHTAPPERKKPRQAEPPAEAGSSSSKVGALSKAAPKTPPAIPDVAEGHVPSLYTMFQVFCVQHRSSC